MALIETLIGFLGVVVGAHWFSRFDRFRKVEAMERKERVEKSYKRGA